MPPVNQDAELHAARSSMIKQRIECGADGAPGEQHIVHQDDTLVLDIETDVGFLNHRLGAQGGKIVPVKGDVQGAYRNRGALHALDDFSQALGQRHASSADAHQPQPLEAAILLHDFVGKANQGALDFRSRHQLRLLTQPAFRRRTLRCHKRLHHTWTHPCSARMFAEVAPPSRRLYGGHPARPSAGKMPALLRSDRVRSNLDAHSL